MTTKELINALKGYVQDFDSFLSYTEAKEIIQRLEEYEKLEKGMKRRRDLV